LELLGLFFEVAGEAAEGLLFEVQRGPVRLEFQGRLGDVLRDQVQGFQGVPVQ
jgi:hypothetical protein